MDYKMIIPLIKYLSSIILAPSIPKKGFLKECVWEGNIDCEGERIEIESIFYRFVKVSIY